MARWNRRSREPAPIWRRLQLRKSASRPQILEFQLALLEDDELSGSAFAEIEAGAPAVRAWRHALDAQIADYSAAEDDTFRARASDLVDLRDRVCRALAGIDQAAPALPEEAIVLADDLAPSRFLEIDWTRSAGVALMAGSPSSHVAMLARARGVPMVVGLGDIPAFDGAWVLLDGDAGEIEIDPSAGRLAEWRDRAAALAEQHAEEGRQVEAPAVTRSGRRIRTLVNIQGLGDLTGDAVHADGVGLVRTEFLFEPGAPRRTRRPRSTPIAGFSNGPASGRSTIRTLDAGGDKPIPGVTLDGEANPFLGVRGLRLSLRRPGLFRTQLRALARAGAYGNLKVMLPMVTTPGELAEARAHLDKAMAELASEGLVAGRPALGIMVEVPAAALAIERLRRRVLLHRQQRPRPVRDGVRPWQWRACGARRSLEPGGARAHRADSRSRQDDRRSGEPLRRHGGGPALCAGFARLRPRGAFGGAVVARASQGGHRAP